jgi:putative addiction module killer protein
MANQIITTEVFDVWFENLSDRVAKHRIQVRIDRVEDGHFGDCQSIGEGLYEMRIHVGAGYRVYFKRVGTKIYLLLAGGNKSTQAKDIQVALRLGREFGRKAWPE